MRLTSPMFLLRLTSGHTHSRPLDTSSSRIQWSCRRSGWEGEWHTVAALPWVPYSGSLKRTATENDQSQQQSARKCSS